MSFISYAQNFEDVMLWRALKHIKNGFFIDVGAWSPDLDSVTRAFYENNWHGINVEPNPEFYQQYLVRRSEDINLQVAVSDEIGTTEIYFVSNPGLSSLDKTIAEGHNALGWTTTPAQVSVTTIAEICKQHASDREIHFLKVDIEGFEKQALLGNDWNIFRPWIVVVEATLPMSQVENHHEWEPILVNANYKFAYADGLNRFYVAQEHSELLEAFKYPPNVFDKFILAPHLEAHTRAEQAQSQAAEANARAEQAQSQAAEANARAEQAQSQAAEANARAEQAQSQAAEANARAEQAQSQAAEAWQQYHLIVNSNSWKLTYPLRVISNTIKWFTRGIIAWLTFSPTSRPRRIARKAKALLKTNLAYTTGEVYGCGLTSDQPSILVDMYVLGQDVKTGVYRVCDEIYTRLVSSSEFNVNYYLKEPFTEQAKIYMKEQNFPCSSNHTSLSKIQNKITFFIAPFGVSPSEIISIRTIKQVHIIYDLIAIHYPEYFSEEGAIEVKSIIDSLSTDTIIFAISEYTKNDLLSYRKDLTPEQITVIPLAADQKFIPYIDRDKQISMFTKYSIPQAPYILSLATLEIRKNMETVIEAYYEYLKQNPDSKVNLVLAGMSGWKLQEVEKKVKQHKALSHRIIFTGFIDDNDLPALYSGALCFVYLSRYEGFGLPPLEAMACGVPVITSNNSSLPEVVGSAGLMFDCDDYQSVANAIHNICADKEYQNELSRKSLEHSKLFNWDDTVEIIKKRLKRECDARE